MAAAVMVATFRAVSAFKHEDFQLMQHYLHQEGLKIKLQKHPEESQAVTLTLALEALCCVVLFPWLFLAAPAVGSYPSHGARCCALRAAVQSFLSLLCCPQRIVLPPAWRSGPLLNGWELFLEG